MARQLLEVEWVRDATGGTVSCSNDAKQADHLHITSTVTSNVVGRRSSPRSTRSSRRT
jgi:hypothetical protein